MLNNCITQEAINDKLASTPSSLERIKLLFSSESAQKLIGLFQDKKKISFSLKINVHKEAVKHVLVMSVKLNQEFDERHRQKVVTPLQTLNTPEIERLTSIWLHFVLEERRMKDMVTRT